MAQAVFDLVTHPEYIESLRDEVRRVKASDGDTYMDESKYNKTYKDGQFYERIATISSSRARYDRHAPVAALRTPALF